jgi:hypothetical protein
MDPISRIFGSAARVKLLRLFLFNRSDAFPLSEIATRAKVSPEETRRELGILTASGILKKTTSGKQVLYRVNHHFEHLAAFEAFVRTTTTTRPSVLLASFKRAGTLRLVLLSGFFTGSTESELDILVVGDKLDERSLGRTITSLEAELGREIRYATFSTEDFRYRLGIYDRLLRDVFDYPHQLLLDKIGL